MSLRIKGLDFRFGSSSKALVFRALTSCKGLTFGLIVFGLRRTLHRRRRLGCFADNPIAKVEIIVVANNEFTTDVVRHFLNVSHEGLPAVVIGAQDVGNLVTGHVVDKHILVIVEAAEVSLFENLDCVFEFVVRNPQLALDQIFGHVENSGHLGRRTRH